MRFQVSGFRFRLLGAFGALAISLALPAGCNMVWRRILPDPEKNQVIRVEKGERLYFDLEEDVAAGCVWSADCNDADVEVTVDHTAPEAMSFGGQRSLGAAAVRIRIHRGYDGPTTVRFRYGPPGEPSQKEFTLSLFRRTGDCAFWK